MVLAHTSNEFQYSGVNISGWCMTPQFPNAHPSRSVATTYTLKLLLTGEWSPAKDALQAGLISEVYEKEERAKEVVEKLAGRNREALVLGKFSFWRANGGAGKEFEDRFQEITKVRGCSGWSVAPFVALEFDLQPLTARAQYAKRREHSSRVSWILQKVDPANHCRYVTRSPLDRPKLESWDETLKNLVLDFYYL